MKRSSPAEAGSARSLSDERSSRKEPGIKREAVIPVESLTKSGQDPDVVWGEYFANHHPTARAVQSATSTLFKKKNYSHVIGLIEAALIEGQSQPWMYDALASALQGAKRPQAEIDRALLSSTDILPVNYDNALTAATFLQTFGRDDRALQYFRLASQFDQTAVEPYKQGLRLACDLKDAAGAEWAASGILRWVWTPDYAVRHREAEGLVEDLARKLRSENRATEADKLLAGIAAARQCDLIVDLKWNGEGDLDLLIEEPQGSVCSHSQPRTAGGGVLLNDGFGPEQKDTQERYVCPEGFPGEYRIRVRHSGGNIVGKQATVTVTRYAGSKQEIVEPMVVQLSSVDNALKTTLANGRLKEPVRLPAPEKPHALFQRRQAPVIQQVGGTAASSREYSKWIESRQQAPGAFASGVSGIGFQPVISVIPEGVSLSARAVVSPDRRYVRISVSPNFTNITDVFTFGFVNSGGGATGGGQR